MGSAGFFIIHRIAGTCSIGVVLVGFLIFRSPEAEPRFQGSACPDLKDHVSRVIIMVTIFNVYLLITTIKGLITLLTKSHDPPSNQGRHRPPHRGRSAGTLLTSIASRSTPVEWAPEVTLFRIKMHFLLNFPIRSWL